ncbi:MAG: AAA family ATPase [Methanotrichaceae archaeon]
MRVITLANQKGGCAKTTSAVNIASYLALKGNKVLLIDLDPQGAASTSLGIDKWNIDKTIYNALVDDYSIEDVILPTKIEGLSIAPTNLNMSGAELELANEIGRESILKNKISSLNFDFIIIDTPPSLGILTLNALVACNTLIIPVQTEFFAMEGMSQLLKIVDMVRDRLGNRMDSRFVLTMYDARTNLSREVADQIRSHFKDEVFRAVIPRSVKLAEAPSHGLPICLYDPESTGAVAYKQLADEVSA